jgi:hypothetical protein
VDFLHKSGFGYEPKYERAIEYDRPEVIEYLWNNSIWDPQEPRGDR